MSSLFLARRLLNLEVVGFAPPPSPVPPLPVMLLMLEGSLEEAFFELAVEEVLASGGGSGAEGEGDVGGEDGVPDVAVVPPVAPPRRWRRDLLFDLGDPHAPTPTPLTPPSSPDSVDALASVVDSDGFPLLLARRAVSRFRLARSPVVPSSSSSSPRRSRRRRRLSPRYVLDSPPRCVRHRKK